MTGRLLALTTLLACGCGDRAHKPPAINVEAQRKAAEEPARAQRFEELLGSGKKALVAKRRQRVLTPFPPFFTPHPSCGVVTPQRVPFCRSPGRERQLKHATDLYLQRSIARMV